MVTDFLPNDMVLKGFCLNYRYNYHIRNPKMTGHLWNLLREHKGWGVYLCLKAGNRFSWEIHLDGLESEHFYLTYDLPYESFPTGWSVPCGNLEALLCLLSTVKWLGRALIYNFLISVTCWIFLASPKRSFERTWIVHGIKAMLCSLSVLRTWNGARTTCLQGRNSPNRREGCLKES